MQVSAWRIRDVIAGAWGSGSGLEGLLEQIDDHVLRNRADHLTDRDPVFEEEQRRNGAHLVLGRGGGVGVDVDLGELDLALVLVGELLDDGADGSARGAPRGPEVDQGWGLRAQDLAL